MCRDYDGKVTPEEVALLYRKQGGVGVSLVHLRDALLVEADGFVGLGLSFAFVLGGRYLTLSPSSSPKDRGASLARDIVETMRSFEVERKDERGGPLLRLSRCLDLVLQETLPSTTCGRRVVGSRDKRRSSPLLGLKGTSKGLGWGWEVERKRLFSVSCALGFHKGQLPCFAWNCGFGSQQLGLDGLVLTFRAWFCRFGSPLAWVVTLSTGSEMKMPIHLSGGM
ncbi:hypothetical protein AAG906_022720 [Vitis piasezkii]